MPKNFTLAMAVVGAALGAALLAAPALAATCQVTTTGAGSQDGSSWTNATTLQGALGNASCTEIWVAAGVYKPTNSTTDRYASFNVGEGVAVYGGFAGTETLRSQADPAARRTVLSGDIDGNDTTTGGISLAAADIVGANSYHVVVMGGTGNVGNAAIGASTVLDGLTITAGKADGSGHAARGGGLYCNGRSRSCSPTLSRLGFHGNSATPYGGAVYLDGRSGISSPTISHSTFNANSATGTFGSGGAIHIDGSNGISSPAISHSTFNANSATGTFGSGGAIHIDSFDGVSNPTISRSTFNSNRAEDSGGAIDISGNGGISNPAISDSTFSANSADAGGAIFTSAYDGQTRRPTVERSIFWGNTAGRGAQAWTDGNAITSFTDSLIQGGCANGGSGGGACAGLLVTSDPQLGPLQDNGGPTPTLLPGANGGAVEAIACAASPGADQRGIARPQGALCDLGAVELQLNGSVALDVTITGNGPVSGGLGACASITSSCNASYRLSGEPSPVPTSVALQATTTTPSYTFTGWGGACSGTGACSVTMDQARSVTASFAPTYAITHNASPTAGGSVTCPARVTHGDNATCTASAPNSGYAFTGFAGCDSASGTTCTLSNVTGPRSVTAQYTLNSYVISANASPAAGGSILTCPAAANHGTGATCTASAPNAGFTFTGFTGDCTSQNVSARTCTLSNITGPRNVQANYAALTTFSGTTVPATGAGGWASASFTGGGAACRFDTTATGYVAATPPPGRQAPQGALRLKLIGCTPGATVRVTTTWPQPVADFTKRSQSVFLPASHFTISGNTVSFDVTDGGLGDDDGLPDGVITDPAMPLAAALATTAIPTLSEWGLLWLAATLMLLAWRMRGNDRFLPHRS